MRFPTVFHRPLNVRVSVRVRDGVRGPLASLYYTALYYAMLYYTILYYTVLRCTVLDYTMIYDTMI